MPKTPTKRRRTRKPRAQQPRQEQYAFDPATIKVTRPEPAKVEPPKTERVARTVSWPKTWWQHLKQDLFPAWARLRWPVKEESLTYWLDVPVEPETFMAGAAIEPDTLGALVTINGQVVGRAMGGQAEFTSGGSTVRVTSSAAEPGVYRQTTVKVGGGEG